MDSRHPIEIICSHRVEPIQLMFALRAIELLPTRVDYSIAASIHGLVLCGETETALQPAVELLKSVFGNDLRVGDVTIRYRHGGSGVEEPYMGVRVSCPIAYFDAVKKDLAARTAVVLDSEATAPVAVLRASVPMAKLLGYSQQLAALTSGTAREVIWFSHYAPLVNGARTERAGSKASVG